VRNYFNKIAGPILDRIDIEILVGRVPCGELLGAIKGERSEQIRERVREVREIQHIRYQESATEYNARMTNHEVKRYCRLSSETEHVFELAMRRMNLSARSFFRVLKVARTIADLDMSDSVEKRHVLEALSYKNLQRNYDILSAEFSFR
jgi:magnesium chelatase family protein